MHARSRQELYRIFLDFVRAEIQRERAVVNRRMWSVFIWCFVIPALSSITLLLLVKFGVLPRSTRGVIGAIALVFPLSYSVYFLSSEVLSEVPAALKRGGMASTLGVAALEGEWRERVCAGMAKEVNASSREWRFIVASFKADLSRLQYRNRYLTALAGAVFFLIMRGIDTITEGSPPETISLVRRESFLSWIQMESWSSSEFVGLGLFLVLLYLSGTQAYHMFERFLSCAQLIQLEREKDTD